MKKEKTVYDVIVSKIGWVQIEAENEDKAMKIAEKLKDTSIEWNDGHVATDVEVYGITIPNGNFISEDDI